MQRLIAGLRDWRTTVPAAALGVGLIAMPADWWSALADRLNAAQGALQAAAAVVPLVLALWNSRGPQA